MGSIRPAFILACVWVLMMAGCRQSSSPTGTTEQPIQAPSIIGARATAAAIVRSANAEATAIAVNAERESRSRIVAPTNTPSPTSPPVPTPPPTPTEIPISKNAPGGFLAIRRNHVQFLQWTENQSGGLSGRFQTVTTEDENPLEVAVQNGRLSGTRNGSDITLSFENGNTYSGTLDADLLTLVKPSPTGELVTIEYNRASIGEYNRSARNFRRAIQEQAAQEAEAEARAQAAYDQAFSDCLPFGEAVDRVRPFVFNPDGTGPAGVCADQVIAGRTLLEAMKHTCKNYGGSDTEKGCDFGADPVLYSSYIASNNTPTPVSQERAGVLVTLQNVNLSSPSTSVAVIVKNDTPNVVRVHCDRIEAVQGDKPKRSDNCSAWDTEDQHGTSPAVPVATIPAGRGALIGFSFAQLDPSVPVIFKIPFSKRQAGKLDTLSLKWKIGSTIEAPTTTRYVSTANDGYSGLNLHTLPNFNADIKQTMPHGAVLRAEVVPVVDLEGIEWYRVLYRGQTGFALGRFLSDEAP